MSAFADATSYKNERLRSAFSTFAILLQKITTEKSMARKGLGRGLGAIFGEETVATATEKRKAKTSASSKNNGASDTTSKDVSRETSEIKLSLIEPNTDQPRKDFNEESLNELAASIKEHGVIQPIIVRKQGRTYRIIAGERRWRAARIAGLKEIPAIVREYDDKETAEIALIENIQREDLNSVEEAKAYRSLIDDYHLTQDELAQRLSKSRTAITNSLRLLQFDDDILELIGSGELSAGHARAVLAVNGKKAQYKAAREIINNGLSVRDAEKLAKRYNAAKTNKSTADKTEEDPYIRALSDELTEKLHCRVRIVPGGKNKGKIEIEYSSQQELEQLSESLASIENLKGYLQG